MTSPSVIEFYAEAHWGSRYGVVDEFHRTPHKGLDCGLFHGNVDVPALHAGKVVAAAASSSVGHYVTVQRADGFFDTYCHIVLGVSIGQSVVQGQRLGRQAVTQAEGGADWRGQHTHLCLSRTRDGWAVWGYVNVDPTPGVIAVLTGTAGSSSTPFDNTQVRTTPMSDTRLILAHHLTPAPYFLRAQLGSGEVVASQYTQEQANQAAQAIGAQTFEVSSDAELKALQKVLASIPATPATGAASADLSPVLQAIAAGEAQDADALKQLLGAIAQTPANTLAAFGLKRI